MTIRHHPRVIAVTSRLEGRCLASLLVLSDIIVLHGRCLASLLVLSDISVLPHGLGSVVADSVIECAQPRRCRT